VLIVTPQPIIAAIGYSFAFSLRTMLAPERALGGASVASSLIASEVSRTPGRALDPSADKLFHCWNDELQQPIFCALRTAPIEGLIRVNVLELHY
jgi:hypothetical protein